MQPLTTSWQVVMIPAQHAQEPISACFTPHFRCFQVDIIWVALKYNPRIISIPNFIGGDWYIGLIRSLLLQMMGTLQYKSTKCKRCYLAHSNPSVHHFCFIV